MRAWIAALCAAGFLGGCAGLDQFPKASNNYLVDLKKADPDYDTALGLINAAADPGCSARPEQEGKVKVCGPAEQKRIRDEEIERRMRVIDSNFKEFETALAQENVRADFGIGLVQVGVGGAGALVSETASQILSAVSGGLAGAHAAYAKAALFDQALSALLAQMIAGRNATKIRIFERMPLSYQEYSLLQSVQDIEAYAFAGSLPGAIVATSADAKVKNDDALAKLRANTFSDDELARIIRAFVRPPDGAPSNTVNQANLSKLNAWIGQSPVAGLPIANFLTNPELRNLRERAVREIPIP